MVSLFTYLSEVPDKICLSNLVRRMARPYFIEARVSDGIGDSFDALGDESVGNNLKKLASNLLVPKPILTVTRPVSKFTVD
jgi:hypothetical protein